MAPRILSLRRISNKQKVYASGVAPSVAVDPDALAIPPATPSPQPSAPRNQCHASSAQPPLPPAEDRLPDGATKEYAEGGRLAQSFEGKVNDVFPDGVPANTDSSAAKVYFTKKSNNARALFSMRIGLTNDAGFFFANWDRRGA